jgi:hypothetical protein
MQRLIVEEVLMAWEEDLEGERRFTLKGSSEHGSAAWGA